MILLVLLFYINTLNGVICYNVIGNSVSGDNVASTANCNGYPGTTLVGCGFSSDVQNSDGLSFRGYDGTFITGSTCYARAGPSGSISARARCCDLTSWGISNNNCESRESAWGVDGDDEEVGITCSSNNYILFGCAGYSDGEMDGRCPSNVDECNENNDGQTVDRCVAVDGKEDTEQVRAYARCCQSTLYPRSDFICKSIYSVKGTNVVECPYGYYMFNCNYHGPFGRFSVKGTYITSISNTDTCYMNGINADDHAIANCCQFIPPTLVPTKNPTMIPTDIPTNAPTLLPTINPTITPTMDPSTTPSNSPTNTPTKNPTISPTNSPTTLPTELPTESPSETPTLTPSINPTKTPSKDPTQSPSNIPSTVPSNIPSMKPTETPSKITHSPTLTDDGNSVALILKQYGTVIIALFIGIILLLIICMLIICMKKKDKDERNIAIELQSVPPNSQMKSLSNSQMKSFSPEMESNPNNNININTDNMVRDSAHTVYTDVEGENIIRPHKVTQSNDEELYNKANGSTNNGWNTPDNDVWDDETTTRGPPTNLSSVEEVVIIHNKAASIKTSNSDV